MLFILLQMKKISSQIVFIMFQFGHIASQMLRISSQIVFFASQMLQISFQMEKITSQITIFSIQITFIASQIRLLTLLIDVTIPMRLITSRQISLIECMFLLRTVFRVDTAALKRRTRRMIRGKCAGCTLTGKQIIFFSPKSIWD